MKALFHTIALMAALLFSTVHAAAAAQQGSCAAGAAGGIAQSLFAGSLDGSTLSDAEQQRMTAVIGALAGFAFSGGNAQNVNLASSIAVSGIANNRQLHRDEVEWLRNNASAFAREQCAIGNCITDEEALRLLTLQAGRQVDALLATGTAENAAAHAFLEANKPTGQIYASTSNDYVDSRQTWFSATPDQFANQYINLPTIRQASDLYRYFPAVQSTRQGSLDLFINNLAATQQDDVYDLSPTARMDAAREIVLSVSNVMDTFPGEAAVHLNANIFAATAVRKLLSETMSSADIALLSPQEQRERQQLVQMSLLTTVGTLPGGQASGTSRTSIFKKWSETAKRILRGGTAGNRVAGSLTDGQKAGILREASNLPSGNRTLAGTASRAEATELGQAWVGPGYRTASDGRTLVSADGTRQYRPPSPKPNNPHSTTGVQINLETRNPETGRILSNAHLDISE